MTAPVTIIVPVYGGARRTPSAASRASARHAAGGRVPFELLVIDDASPDAAGARARRRFAAAPRPFPVTALHNPENLGFVGTVNRGLRQAAGDVVILNSDTVGHRGLARPARGRGRAPRRRDRHAAYEPRLDLHAARPR